MRTVLRVRAPSPGMPPPGVPFRSVWHLDLEAQLTKHCRAEASPDKIIAEKLEGTVDASIDSRRYQRTVETQGDDSEGLL